MSNDVVCRLHSGRPTRRPVLYLLEIAAALLSVLAIRDVILHGALPLIEALSAAILWIAVFVSVYFPFAKRLVARTPDAFSGLGKRTSGSYR